jgi:uncharacterized OsmC-like protein
MVSVKRMQGKQLLCQAGRHTLVTDRKPADGGADAGCTSGELLLLAAGSCACGSVRNYLEARGLAAAELAVTVDFQPSPTPGARDMIVIALKLPGKTPREEIDTIKAAALSGGVVSRLALGSEIEVRC